MMMQTHTTGETTSGPSLSRKCYLPHHSLLQKKTQSPVIVLIEEAKELLNLVNRYTRKLHVHNLSLARTQDVLPRELELAIGHVHLVIAEHHLVDSST
jgi:hypothetical protein